MTVYNYIYIGITWYCFKWKNNGSYTDSYFNNTTMHINVHVIMFISSRMCDRTKDCKNKEHTVQ